MIKGKDWDNDNFINVFAAIKILYLTDYFFENYTLFFTYHIH